MPIRAETENKFLLKYLLIGLGCLGFFLWSSYDAVVGYPSQLPRAEAWETLKEDKSLTDTERAERWKEISADQSWSDKRPTKKEMLESIQHSIIFNYAFMAIGLGIAVPCLAWYLKSRGTWLEANDNGLENSSGDRVAIDQITQVDKQKWEKKGIAIVHYRDSSQADQTFVIDDLKYQRQPTDRIMDWLEQQLPRDLIVNGMTEAELRAHQAGTQSKKSETGDA